MEETGRRKEPEGPLKLINGSLCTSSERARCVLRGLKPSSIRQMRGQEGGFKWKTNGQQHAHTDGSVERSVFRSNQDFLWSFFNEHAISHSEAAKHAD